MDCSLITSLLHSYWKLCNAGMNGASKPLVYVNNKAETALETGKGVGLEVNVG